MNMFVIHLFNLCKIKIKSQHTLKFAPPPPCNRPKTAVSDYKINVFFYFKLYAKSKKENFEYTESSRQVPFWTSCWIHKRKKWLDILKYRTLMSSNILNVWLVKHKSINLWVPLNWTGMDAKNSIWQRILYIPN